MVRILLIFLTITFKQTTWKISISAFQQLIKWFYIILEDKVKKLRETAVVFTEKASWSSESWYKLQKVTEPGSSTINTQSQVLRCPALPSRLLEGSNLHCNPCPPLWPQPPPSIHMEHRCGMSDHISMSTCLNSSCLPQTSFSSGYIYFNPSHSPTSVSPPTLKTLRANKSVSPPPHSQIWSAREDQWSFSLIAAPQLSPFFPILLWAAGLLALSHYLSGELSTNLTPWHPSTLHLMGSTKLHQLSSQFLDLIMSLQCQPSMAPTAYRKNDKSIPPKFRAALTSISGSAPCSAPGWLMPRISTPHVTFLPASASTEANLTSRFRSICPTLQSLPWHPGHHGAAPTLISITF